MFLPTGYVALYCGTGQYPLLILPTGYVALYFATGQYPLLILPTGRVALYFATGQYPLLILPLSATVPSFTSFECRTFFATKYAFLYTRILTPTQYTVH
jgi:hypothetical protein